MKSCRSCNYWVTTGEELDRDDPDLIGKKVENGVCRRYAPRPFTVELDESGTEPKMISRWPQASSDDGCGEWEPNYG